VTDERAPKVGIGRALVALGDYPAKQLLWPEGIPALVIGLGGSVGVVRATTVAARTGLMSTVIILDTTLLAIVFTALAIVVSLPAGRYLRAMQKDDATSDGMLLFLQPFLLAVGTQMLIVIVAIGYDLVATTLGRIPEHVVFYMLGFVFVYGLFDVAALARSLVRHGVLRAVDAVHDSESPPENLRQLGSGTGR
jgi:small-conductance mechanosensitive channel